MPNPKMTFGIWTDAQAKLFEEILLGAVRCRQASRSRKRSSSLRQSSPALLSNQPADKLSERRARGSGRKDPLCAN
jgi:hypothetical protein